MREGNREMRKFALIALLLVFAAGCATTSSVGIKKGMEGELRKIKTVRLEKFESNGQQLTIIAIRNSIIESFLSSNVGVIEEGEADAIIKGTITLTADSVSGASGAITSSFGMAASLSSSGGYVSGITAQVVKGGEIIASATVTQVRTSDWIPDPAEIMGKKVGRQLVRIMTSPQMGSNF